MGGFMKSFPCVGTCGRGVFNLRINGEMFRGLIRFHRVGTLENVQAYYAEVIDKGDIRTGSEMPSVHWFYTEFTGTPEVHSKARIVNEEGEIVQALPAGAKVPSLASERDYYERILPLLRRLES